MGEQAMLDYTARRATRVPLVVGVSAVILTLSCGFASALPPGKAWIPVAQYKAPGHTFAAIPGRMDTDSTGTPLIFADVGGGIGRDMLVLRWADTTWGVVAALGNGTKLVRAVMSPPGTHYLAWTGLDFIETPTKISSSLLFAQYVDGRITVPDTVAQVWLYVLTCSGAASPRRRWVAVSDLDDMRLFYSDRGRSWTEVPIEGSGIDGAAVTSVDDTTALVVWLGGILEPGRAALVHGSVVEDIDSPPFNALGALAGPMAFRRRPSGGQWMTWPTDDGSVGIATFKDGQWSAPESLKCAYRLNDGYYSKSTAQMSNDEAERPVVAWSSDSARNLIQTICVCVPTDSGYPVAENLENSSFGGAPVVARDKNGDVWVAWWTMVDGWLYWLHSQTTAMASKPEVTAIGPGRQVGWMLSQPAPGSWWAVLRARNDGPFEEAARVEAGRGLEMSWTDSSPPAGVLRYRIRRECLDTRYQWMSEVGLWPPKSGRAFKLAHAAGATMMDGRLELTGADAGSFHVAVYDVQGRLVIEQDSRATGTGRDSVQLDFQDTKSLPNGIYFAAVRDASGRTTNPLKLVILR